MAFEVVCYAYDASDDSSVVVEMSEMPDIYLVVENVMYFADKSGYVMIYPTSGDMSDLAVQSDMPDLPEMCGDDRKWAVNAKWYDESTYGALVPEGVESAVSAIVMALTVLHRMAATDR